MKKGKIWFDGGTFPLNPGDGGAGAVVSVDATEYSFSEYLGKNITNNQAEYQGMILGLKKAKELGITHLTVFGDSQLVIYQMTGMYACRDSKLRSLNGQAKNLVQGFAKCDFTWIPREANGKADEAATKAIKSVIPESQSNIPDNLSINSPIEGLRKKINYLNQAGDRAKFKEWLNLKSGRDQFSSLRGAKLDEAVPEEVKDAIAVGAPLATAKCLTDEEKDELYPKVLRWWLRGLKAEYALKKVRFDAEIARNFQKKGE